MLSSSLSVRSRARSCLPWTTPTDFYADVPEGATIVSTVFEALTSAGSHLLARCLGVGALELGRHAVGCALAADVSALLGAEEFAERVPAFLALREAGLSVLLSAQSLTPPQQPNHALQRTAHGGRVFSEFHVHRAMSRR